MEINFLASPVLFVICVKIIGLVAAETPSEPLCTVFIDHCAPTASRPGRNCFTCHGPFNFKVRISAK